MPIVDPVPTIAAALSSGWTSVLGDAASPSCSEYAGAFHRSALSAREGGRGEQARALELLAAVCRFSLDPDSEDPANGPFVPLATENGRPITPLPADLADGELDIIDALLGDGRLPADMAARFADVLWIRRRDHRAARTAVNAYVRSAEELEAAGDVPLVPSRLSRAARLAKMFGGSRGEANLSVLTAAERLLRRRTGRALVRAGEMLDLILQERPPDPPAIAALAASLAEGQEASSDLFTAKGLWKRAARAWQLAGDEDASRAALIKSAECHVRIAEAGPGALFAASHLESALRAYRKIAGTDERRAELRARLLQAQKQSVGELGRVSAPMNLGDEPDRAQADVRGLPALAAFFTLSISMGAPHDPQETQEQALALAKYSPLTMLPAASAINEMGRVVGKKPDAMSDEAGAVHAEVQRYAGLRRQHDVAGWIGPARRQILLDHGPCSDELHRLAANAVIVPPGRAWLASQALSAGLEGDFAVSTYLLPPLIERAVLVLLARRRVIPSANIDNAEGLNGLSATLRGRHGDAVGETLGQDVRFCLQSILVERFGANLRNKVAHGLLGDRGAYQPDAQYLWWLMLRLVCQTYRGELPDGFEPARTAPN